MKEAIKEIYSNRKNFIIIGVTGKIGSGCTTTADFLASKKSKHNLADFTINESSSDVERKKYIIHKYYNSNWNRFIKITVSDVITSFLLSYNYGKHSNVLKKIVGKKQFSEYVEEFKSFESIDINCKHSKELYKSKLKEKYTFLTRRLPEISSEIKQAISNNGKNYRRYTKLYQEIGDNLRLYGQPFKKGMTDDLRNIYAISERINAYIKIIRSYRKLKQKPTYIVIDAFRNPFEIMYFKERYSAFYLFAVNASYSDIDDRLIKNLHMTIDSIREQDKKESPDKTLDNAKSFVSQNIKACIQKGDIHIANNGKVGEGNFRELFGQIIKYVCLIKHPGLITPSLDEKMMQVAYTAKLNSACLSRQVGAAITNEYGSLKAIGWNSVAEGQTPCLLRCADELFQNTKSISYSNYEKSDEFKNALRKFYPVFKDKNLNGLNKSFCFKDIYNEDKKDKNQVHTRSLHAEENAFLQISKFGGEGIRNGTLYTTASPCELCSKKAYQLGIKRIVYIDPYPGIAQKQILHSGSIPPILNLFNGAIGSAYHKLYEQILPFKDELEALSK